MKQLIFALTVLTAASLYSCNNSGSNNADDETVVSKVPEMSVKTDTVLYNDDSVQLIGFLAVDTIGKLKKPIVIIVPEWWGVGDYVKNRAMQLANMGYLAMVADYYGNGTYVETPAEAQGLASSFYANPMLGKKRFDAALNVAKMSPYADTNRIAAIGYCFGGAQVLNVARMGENINGVVSFHGDLVGVAPTKNMMAKIFVAHGGADQFVDSNQVNTFKKQMDSVGVAYKFKVYENATHAFTNPDATRVGNKNNMPIEYNADADTASWNDMKAFFKEIF